jgi:hypothetical protein
VELVTLIAIKLWEFSAEEGEAVVDKNNADGIIDVKPGMPRVYCARIMAQKS